MCRRIFVSGALFLLLGLLACSDTDRSSSVLIPGPHDNAGDATYSPLLKCPIHSSLVKITLGDTEIGIVADFAVADPALAAWLVDAILPMVPKQAGSVATLGHKVTDGETEKSCGDRATGHGALPLDQMPPVRIWAEKTDTGVCLQFAPKDPAQCEELRLAVRTVFKSLVEGPCFQ